MADQQSPATVPEGQRVYAFGDVHGRDDLLADIFAKVASDLRKRKPSARVTLVGIGDYIDRGPRSKQVVDLLIRGVSGCSLVCLRGNHEKMMLDFLDDPLEETNWLDNGGETTLRSYGVPLPRGASDTRTLLLVRDHFARALPDSHRTFFQQTRMLLEIGDYLFVHAGVRLGRPLREQLIDDLLWIRDGFSDVDEPFDRFVVHGHTPIDSPFLGRHRINLDTGAFATGHLSCIVLEGSQRELLAS